MALQTYECVAMKSTWQPLHAPKNLVNQSSASPRHLSGPPPHGGGLLRAQRRQISPARLPGAFQERSIRIFVTDAEYEPAAREALAAWCEQDACVDGCEVAYE